MNNPTEHCALHPKPENERLVWNSSITTKILNRNTENKYKQPKDEIDSPIRINNKFLTLINQNDWISQQN